MLCVSCKVEISPTFKHAIAQNICPACGNCLLDEETLALVENIKSTIANEAKLRDETVHKLAMALLSQYSISFRDDVQSVVAHDYVPTMPTPAQPAVEQLKVAPQSTMKQVVDQRKQEVITAEEVMPKGISDVERERIMEEVVRERYAVVDQIQSTAMTGDFDDDIGEVSPESLFTEGDANPILEQERLARLAKQKQAMSGKKPGAFSRSG